MQVHHPELMMKPKLWQVYSIDRHYNHAEVSSHLQQPLGQYKLTVNEEHHQNTEST